MGIKWDDVKILLSPISNQLYLGKLDKSGMFATDKSKDMTEEIKSAVIAHMDAELKDGQNIIVYECEAGNLTWERK